jgi:hypothetical protein
LELASSILVAGKIPRKAATDAAHIAIATVHRMDFLRRSAASMGMNVIICTPEELMGE